MAKICNVFFLIVKFLLELTFALGIVLFGLVLVALITAIEVWMDFRKNGLRFRWRNIKTHGVH